MTVFADLLSEVYIITNRSDLVNETKTAVKAATLKMHQLDYFWKDLKEVGIDFEAAAYRQDLDYRAFEPQFRSMKYLRKAESDGTAGIFFTAITPAMVFDKYAVEQEDVYYAAGAFYKVKSSTEFQYALMGCYVNPVITEASYSSWIALDHPYAIIYEAAAKIFKMIGYSDQETSAARDVLEQIAMLRESNILSEGY